MNRSIMVVICDFIVLSMLSMMPGLSPTLGDGSLSARSGGSAEAGIDTYTSQVIITELRKQMEKLEAARAALLKQQQELGFDEERARQLEQLNRELSEAKEKLTYLEKQLALSPENLGELSAEELQQMLSEERRARELLALEKADVNTELEQVRRQYQTASGDLAALQQQYQTATHQLEQTSQELAAKQQELLATGNELQNTRNALDTTTAQLETASGELTAARGQLTTATNRIVETDGKLKDAELSYSFMQGKLSATEKELADARSRLETTQRSIYTRDLELSDHKKQLENLQNVLKNAVSDLTRAKGELKALTNAKTATETELNQAKTNIARLEGEIATRQTELDNTREQLALAEERLRSDVYEKYADSTVRLDFNLKDRRLLLDHAVRKSFFLPVVAVGGKNFLISALRLLTDMLNVPEAYGKVYDLSSQWLPPEAENTTASVPAGALYAVKEDVRVGMLEAPQISAAQLNLLTVSELKKRGLHELYLFKKDSFGKDSAPLEVRCSMSMAADDEYLYIRNSTRLAGSELKADIGDIVMTKQGDFVGVVVGIENFDMGRKQEAKCFVFPDQFSLEGTEIVPTTKTAQEEYFRQFSQTLQKLQDQYKLLDAKVRQRQN
ncbi:hypothetical protein [Victivallis sp. Marseille-Q1083]|uniref:hypothetical protein n=1 Tax=Victivallis sp. Marseille-Q1083 TaxID=2717288 RepID=UPI00158A71C7|nr:hypothetical protein [Victivallis sp. Marseille-Q1083]